MVKVTSNGVLNLKWFCTMDYKLQNCKFSDSESCDDTFSLKHNNMYVCIVQRYSNIVQNVVS